MFIHVLSFFFSSFFHFDHGIVADLLGFYHGFECRPFRYIIGNILSDFEVLDMILIL